MDEDRLDWYSLLISWLFVSCDESRIWIHWTTMIHPLASSFFSARPVQKVTHGPSAVECVNLAWSSCVPFQVAHRATPSVPMMSFFRPLCYFQRFSLRLHFANILITIPWKNGCSLRLPGLRHTPPVVLVGLVASIHSMDAATTPPKPNIISSRRLTGDRAERPRTTLQSHSWRRVARPLRMTRSLPSEPHRAGGWVAPCAQLTAEQNGHKWA